MAPRRSLPVQYHVRADANETLDFDRIVRYISFHGFCSIETDVKHKDACRQAVREARRLETSFQATPEIVIDGLLGEDGSARTAAFTSAPGEMLQQMDEVLSLYTAGFTKSTSAADIGVRSAERTAALLHEAGNLDQDPTAITEAEVQSWLPIFLRHQIMLILFLGPSRGTLELQPFDEEGLPMRLATEPGMLVALRADLLWRRYSCAPGSTGYALSCFLLGPEAVGKSRTPMAAKLDQWMLRRIEAAAEKGDPRWIYSLDHMYHKGEQFAVRGAACKFSVNWDPFHFSNAILSGADFGTEVPISRWDHVPYYSPEPDGWRELKVSCKHTCMIDGLELFDSRFFRIAPAEVKGMDPLQRQILEVGYAALHDAGQTSKTLLQSLTAIYVASPLSEWMAIDTGPEESGGCAQRSAGTGVAGSIMSNRFSFVFGMNGPSVTFDTDASSSLVILDAGLLALDNRRNQASQSCCTAVNAVLTPLTWINRVAMGHMTQIGRCLTFGAHCDGWIKSENFASVVVDVLAPSVDGLRVEDDRPYVGSLAGVAVTQCGQAATLDTPHGPAVQKILVDACRHSSLQCSSVDAMECHGEALALSDAIEVKSLCTALGVGMDRLPLHTSAVKTNIGNGLHGSALASVLKVLFSQRKGVMMPLQHLYQINPQTQDAAEQNIMLSTENVRFYTRSSVYGVLANGWGGTMGCVMCTGSSHGHRGHSDVENYSRSSMMLWLGGGGDAPRPEKAYYLSGSWNNWGPGGIAMIEEAPGVFAANLKMNQICEDFCIALDGAQKRHLKPQEGWNQSGSRAYLGEGPLQRGTCWRIADEVGVTFTVRLVTSGKWQVVTWERSPDTKESENGQQAEKAIVC